MQTAGSVRGTVRSGNQPIAGIPVYLEGADGSVRETTSGPDGSYVFADVPAGKYNPTTRTVPTRRNRFEDERKPAWHSVEAGQSLALDLVYYPYDPISPDMPYGAPPARRRIV